jgi:hypothetical protein
VLAVLFCHALIYTLLGWLRGSLSLSLFNLIWCCKVAAF